jgi:predicted nuclease of predicted toxin-antitoxin system
MSLRIVVDMNLSVEWAPFLGHAGWSAVHWSSIGALLVVEPAKSRVRVLPL